MVLGFKKNVGLDKTKSLILFAVLCAVVTSWGGRALALKADEPLSQMENTVNKALALLKDPVLKKQQVLRQQKLYELIDYRFDFQLMGRLALGPAWKTVDAGARDTFVRLFADLLKNTYVRRVDSYTDGRITFLKQLKRNKLAFVYSKYENNNDTMSINYKMINRNGIWRVYDVVIEGVSIVKQYRRQFAQILLNEQMSGLIKRLKAKLKVLKKVEDQPAKSQL
ncbi:MAG TPA: ABC transporter substrate-binding protein [Desulfobacterales bacterium]|nr:ABC transporter substrate-binding protein [Desulfobacterales bacterium]